MSAPDDLPRPGFLRPFAALSALGLVGLLGLLPLLGPVAGRLAALPDAPLRSPVLLSLLLLVQPALILLALTALGTALAHRVGLRSLLASAARREPVGRAPGGKVVRLLATTALLSALVLAADLGLARAFPDAFRGVPHAGDVPWAARIGALLYGGVAEELMLRFGVMSALVWLGARLAPGAFARSPGLVVWPAIALAAVLFGLAHLPAMAGVAPLSGPVVARTVALNLALGLLYGRAYWRIGLEYAMLSHAFTHVVLGLLGAALSRAAAAL